MSASDQLPLPHYKHLPGKNARPNDDLLESIAAQASESTSDSNFLGNIAWRYGIRLFNEGYYWETHEVLEAVWLNAVPNSREKHLVQGVIQIANARLKSLLNQPKACGRLSALASECITRAYPAHLRKDGQKTLLLMGLEANAMRLAALECANSEVSISLQSGT